MGRAAEAIPQIETALRLSPRDPELSSFEFNMCSAYTHLAQWEKTVEWCKRSVATRPSLWLPYMHLAAANGWLGRDAEAKTAVADLLKLRPGFTVQQFANMKWSDNPSINANTRGSSKVCARRGCRRGTRTRISRARAR
jgi:adenylate cyclase